MMFDIFFCVCVKNFVFLEIFWIKYSVFFWFNLLDGFRFRINIILFFFIMNCWMFILIFFLIFFVVYFVLVLLVFIFFLGNFNDLFWLFYFLIIKYLFIVGFNSIASYVGIVNLYDLNFLKLFLNLGICDFSVFMLLIIFLVNLFKFMFVFKDVFCLYVKSM